MTCNPLITPSHPQPGWEAWCLPCNWFGPARTEFWQAKNDKLRHTGTDPETHPPWQRGPAR